MPLVSLTNTTFDLYRGYAPATPYTPPNRPAAFQSLRGILKHHVRCGKFGYLIPGQGNAAIYWTNVLLLPLTQDIRDGYDSELDTDPIANGDTVMVYDYPNPGDCCAFVVVMVQRQGRGTNRDFLRCYLDRAQPLWNSACPDPTAGGTGIVVTCCPTAIPTTLYATITTVESGSCLCVGTTTVTLTYTLPGGSWLGTAALGSCGRDISVELLCDTFGFYIDSRVSDNCGGPWSDVRGTLASCSPFHWSAGIGYDGIGTCGCDNPPVDLNIVITE